MAEWLECGRSQVRFPAGVATKDFADVRDLLSAPVSTGLSKDSGSILLGTLYKTKKNITKFPYKHYIRWSWILINSQQIEPIFLPNDH